MNDHELAELLRLTAGVHEDHQVWWRPAPEGTDDPLAFYVNCSDFFMWGCADAEPLSDPSLLANALRDVLDVTGAEWTGPEGYLLYCARSRNARPQGAFYPHLHSATWPLFDACGEEREAGIGNPHVRPGAGLQESSAAETRPIRANRYDLVLPPPGADLATRPASLATFRRALNRTGFEYTDSLRWIVDESNDLRLFAVAFDTPEEWSWTAAEITDDNIKRLIELFDMAEAGEGVYGAYTSEIAAAFMSAACAT